MKKLIWFVFLPLLFYSCGTNEIENWDKVFVQSNKNGQVNIQLQDLAQISNKEALQLFNKSDDEFKKKNYENAKELLLQANELEPQNPYILNNLGFIENTLGNNSKAMILLDQAIEIDHKIPSSYLNKATIFINLNKRRKAIPILEKGLELASTKKNNSKVFKTMLYTLISKANYEIGECKESQSYAEKGLSISQNEDLNKLLKNLISKSKTCLKQYKTKYNIDGTWNWKNYNGKIEKLQLILKKDKSIDLLINSNSILGNDELSNSLEYKLDQNKKPFVLYLKISDKNGNHQLQEFGKITPLKPNKIIFRQTYPRTTPDIILLREI
ncbi:MAG TPA: hypothetical protein VK021_10625 [Flavobacteriaceae bacterium]|nr:hypothetical protein [Flavobacteriaceae bacterium]